jgi:hypothetical protein
MASMKSSAPSLARQQDSRLNVLMLAVDDLRPELGPWGFDHLVTPAIDELVRQTFV